MYNLLLIDDDEEVLILNKTYFSKKGYAVKIASSAQEGMNTLNEFSPDCILLDVMMPETDGFKACKNMRQITNAPILFLTGKADEHSKVNGLMIGGDDYIVKPYALVELEARILANVRRYKQSPDRSQNKITLPPIEIDLLEHTVYARSENIGLSGREYELMLLFAQKHLKKEIVTFETLGKKMWGVYRKEDHAVITLSVSRLRKKLLLYLKENECYIETIRGKGYALKIRKRS